MKRAHWVRALVVFLAAAGSAFSAQAAEPLEQALGRRLDPETYGPVYRILADARAAVLPLQPLMATALEGATLHATPDRIIRALKREVRDLKRAREALGASAGDGDIAAGASALRAGIREETLSHLRAEKSGPLLTVLVVLTDLVVRGVPVERASTSMIELAHSGVSDDGLLRLRERVAQDILAGGSPEHALILRSNGLRAELEAGTPAAIAGPPRSNP